LPDPPLTTCLSRYDLEIMRRYEETYVKLSTTDVKLMKRISGSDRGNRKGEGDLPERHRMIRRCEGRSVRHGGGIDLHGRDETLLRSTEL
jgi:hypothetical protein